MVGPMSIETKTLPRQGKLLSFSENRFGYLAVLAALAIGIYTIYTLAQFDPAQSDSGQLATLIAVDVLAVIIVGAFVIRQILRLWVERRQKLAGYQLHWRLALLFGGWDESHEDALDDTWIYDSTKLEESKRWRRWEERSTYTVEITKERTAPPSIGRAALRAAGC